MTTPDKASDELRVGLLAMTESLAPLYEAAEGQRAELERRGWSPSAAETVALRILDGMLTALFENPRP